MRARVALRISFLLLGGPTVAFVACRERTPPAVDAAAASTAETGGAGALAAVKELPSKEACAQAREEGERLSKLAYESASTVCESSDDCALVPMGCGQDCERRAIRKSDVESFERGDRAARAQCATYWGKACRDLLPRSVADCSPPSAFCESGKCIAASRRAYVAGDRMILREPFVFDGREVGTKMGSVLDDIADLAKQAPKKRVSIIVSQEEEAEALTPEHAKALHQAAVDQATARATAFVKALVARGVPPAQLVGKHGASKERVSISLSELH